MNRIVDVFDKRKVLLPVIHAVTEEQVARNAELALEHGADGLLVINQGGLNASDVLRVAGMLARLGRVVGVNLLGETRNSALARLGEWNSTGLGGPLRALWVDDAGVDPADHGGHMLESFNIRRRRLEALASMHRGPAARAGLASLLRELGAEKLPGRVELETGDALHATLRQTEVWVQYTAPERLEHVRGLSDAMGLPRPAGDALAAQAGAAWALVYFGGVAFKGQQPVAPELYGRVATAAANGVDVVTTSGPQTGEPPSVEKVAQMRHALGNHALGLASGVTPENVTSFLPFVDAFLVATGIERSFGEFDAARLRDLATTIHAWEGTAS